MFKPILDGSCFRFLPHGGCYIAGGGIASKLKAQLSDGYACLYSPHHFQATGVFTLSHDNDRRLIEAYKSKGHSFACYDSVPV